jgi:hypothetical protein
MTDTNNEAQNFQENKKSIPVSLMAVTIILSGILIFLVIMYFDQKNKMFEMETVLTQEKDSLANELRILAYRFDTLKTDNDTLNANLDKQKQRITRLLSVNASNVQLIRQYRNEISTMREIMKSYIVQIDSLNTRNKILVAENVQFKEEIKKVQDSNVELSKVKDELSTKVEKASVIQAKNIIVTPLNRKRKETRRINLLEKLMVCFTLRENPIIEAGPKKVYMRVIRPDSLVITNSSDNIFSYNDQLLIFSANRTADYMNQDIDMCIYLDNTGDFIIGNYTVELYLENNIIGRANFMLPR